MVLDTEEQKILLIKLINSIVISGNFINIKETIKEIENLIDSIENAKIISKGNIKIIKE